MISLELDSATIACRESALRHRALPASKGKFTRMVLLEADAAVNGADMIRKVLSSDTEIKYFESSVK